MNICIIRLSSMGDVILATPLFSFLRQQYPLASLTFVTGSGYAGLFSDDPRLAEVVGIDSGTSELPNSLTAPAWDLVVDLQNSARSRALRRQLRQVFRTGFFDKQHWQRFMLLVFRRTLYEPSLHVAARYLRAAGLNPAPGELPPISLFFKEERCGRFRTVFCGSGRPALAMFPFSAWKNKEWPATSFVKVGRHFLDKGWNVAVFGSPADVNRAAAMRDRIGGRCVSLAGAITLYECGCLLKGCDLALGNDTGLSHLARACGVKAGILFGPTTRHFGFYPYGEPPYRIFEEQLFCRPCHAHGGNLCPRLTRRCMKMIDDARVIAGLVELDSAK
jgi:ADP-heptose:LPS heptosyltransferase